VTSGLFAQFLRGLGSHDLIVQTADGTLLPGELGERIINHYTFFTAFKTPAEYRLVTDGRTLGTLPIDYPIVPGQFLIFGGTRWRVTSVDAQHNVIDLTPAPGGRPPLFRGTEIPVHDRVRQQMRDIYRSGDIPSYLDAAARDLLKEARANFARLGLVESQVIACGGDALLFPWMGSRVMNTIYLQLQRYGRSVTLDGLAISVDDCEPRELYRLLRKVVAEGPADGPSLAADASNKVVEKYDAFLPEELLSLDYASRRLDPIGAWETLRGILEGAPTATQAQVQHAPATTAPPKAPRSQ
jgi:ATP-dependent Lhr-like helicase